MIGVAPPSLGSNTPPVGAPPADPVPVPVPGGAAPPPDFGATQAMGGPPAPAPGYGATQQGYGSPGGGYPPPGYAQQPPPNAPSSAVNPLGGTVVADASAFSNPAYGNVPGQAPGGFDPNAAPQGYAPPQGGGYAPPGAAPGYGGGYDPNQGGYGAPQGGYGAPQQGGYAPGGGFGATEPAGASYGGNMQPYQPMPPIHEGGMSQNMDVAGTVGGPNPIVTVLLIVCTCGIYGIYLLVKGKKAQGG
jgi:hypothetical protein